MTELTPYAGKKWHERCNFSSMSDEEKTTYLQNNWNGTIGSEEQEYIKLLLKQITALTLRVEALEKAK